jgi:four helix bundle protein
VPRVKGENISIRLRKFAAQVVRLCRTFPEDPASKHILRQLVRAATGGGANYEEARGAESRADFIHKVGIANKEMREALYWLRLVEDAGVVANAHVDALAREANELVAILTSSIRTAKQREVTSCGEERSWRTRDGGEPSSWWPCAPSE